MTATQKVPVHIVPSVPQLRIFRKLDVDGLSEEFIEKVGAEEGDFEYVDVDRARDGVYTDEIMEYTIGAALVDSEGSILHEWDGADAVARAERAKGSARVTIDMDVDVDEDADQD